MDFDEIKKTWNKSYENKQINDDEIKARLTIKTRSYNIMGKIISSYIYGMITLGAVYIIALILLIFSLKSLMLYLFISLLTSFTGIAFAISYKNYKKIKQSAHQDGTVRPSLIKTINIMEKSLKFGMGNLYKYLLIPLAFVFGIAIGIYVGSGNKTFLETIYHLETKSIIKIILVIVIGSGITIPFSQFTMKKMYKNHLDDLKKCLNELNESDKV